MKTFLKVKGQLCLAWVRQQAGRLVKAAVAFWQKPYGPRVVVCSMAALLLLGCALPFAAAGQTYLIRADGKQIVVSTNQKDAKALLALAGLSLGKNDLLEKTGENQYALLRAYTVAVQVDGETKNITLAKGDVEDVLRLAKVELSAKDQVSQTLDTPTGPKMEIIVSRVDYQERVVKEPIAYGTTTTYSYALGVGQTQVVKMGQKGEKQLVYKDKVVDGKIVSSQLIKETVTKQPQNQVVQAGKSPRQPLSLITPPDDFALNANGVPTKYIKVIRGGKATAYSARAGSLTASGRRAYQGTVAVNPKIIPYGTPLYIVSSDGKHVYGYAIAADTGTALMQGRIAVDLFFNTYEDSCRWGAKKVDIYVLG